MPNRPARPKRDEGSRSSAVKCISCGHAMESVFQRKGRAFARVPGLFYCPADDRFAHADRFSASGRAGVSAAAGE